MQQPARKAGRVQNKKPQINADERRFIARDQRLLAFNFLFPRLFKVSIKTHSATRPKGGAVQEKKSTANSYERMRIPEKR